MPDFFFFFNFIFFYAVNQIPSLFVCLLLFSLNIAIGPCHARTNKKQTMSVVFFKKKISSSSDLLRSVVNAKLKAHD